MLLSCPSCQKHLNVSDSALGKHVRCPLCGTTFLSPSPTAVVLAVPAAPVMPAMELSTTADMAAGAAPTPRAPHPSAQVDSQANAPVSRPALPPPLPTGFDDDVPSLLAADAGPEKDFSFEGAMEVGANVAGIGTWPRLRAHATFMKVVGFLFLLMGGLVVLLAAAVAVEVRVPRWWVPPALVFFALLPTNVAPTVFIFIGAAFLKRGKGKGFVITGAVFLLLMALGALIMVFLTVVGMVHGKHPIFSFFCLQIPLYLAAAVLGVLAGVKVFLLLAEPQVSAIYGERPAFFAEQRPRRRLT